MVTRKPSPGQMTLWPELDPPRTGPRGFPLCECGREGIGPRTSWCYRCWTPERDPEGAASWTAITGEVLL